MKTRTIITALLFAVWVIPAQAQLNAPEINVKVMPNNRVELNSDLHLMQSSTASSAYINTNG